MMPLTTIEERRRWRSQLMGVFAQPSGEIVERGGRDFARTLRKRCPQCGVEFWTYQMVGMERAPGMADPEPGPGDVFQQRETCGDPACWEAEQEHQFARRMMRDHARALAPKPIMQQDQRPRLKKKSEMTSLKEIGDTSA